MPRGAPWFLRQVDETTPPHRELRAVDGARRHDHHPPFGVDRAFVLLSALPITAGIVLVAGMLLAAIAFTSATSIQIPFVVTFGGFEDESGAHAVSVAESWAAAAALTFILAGPLAAVALRYGRD